MRIVVSTCGKYHHLLPGFFWCFRKYYGDACVDLVTDIPWATESAGVTQYAAGTASWSRLVGSYLSQTTGPYLLLLDDYWLTRHVEHTMINAAADLIAGGQCDKVDLSLNTACFAHALMADTRFIRAESTAPYRTSLQPAIWSRGMLHAMAAGDKGIWQAETQHPFSPNYTILQWNTPERVYDYANIYRKGKPNIQQLCQLRFEDMTELKRMGYLPDVPDITPDTYLLARQRGSHQFKCAVKC